VEEGSMTEYEKEEEEKNASEIHRKMCHIRDQMRKRHWLNVLCTINEINRIAIYEFSANAKGHRRYYDG
jgi:hypothetical protein